MFKKNSKTNLEWLTYPIFDPFPELVHATFLRHGGVSSSPFHSLNFSFTSKDLFANVEANRAFAFELLNFSNVAFLKQIHSKNVIHAKFGIQEQGDSLITNQLQRALLILHADCQAAIFYDPMKGALANVHCGWRGNVLNIYKETLDAMNQAFGTKPEDVHVAISPSLGPNAAEFIHFKKEFPQELWNFQVKPNYFDLWALSHFQLEEAGILPHHIECSKLCTFEDKDNFFSYRHAKITGRNATVAMLKKR